MIALAFGVLEDGTAVTLGLVFVAYEAASVALLLAGGVWADRLQRRVILAAGYAAEGVATAGMAIVLWRGSPSVVVLSLLAAVRGGAGAFVSPAQTGFVPELVTAEHLQAANSLGQLTWSTSRIVGSLIGAGAVALVGAPSALAVDAASFLIAGWLILGVGRQTSRPPRGTSPLADLREGWHEFTARTWVWVMVLGFAFFQVSYFPAFIVLGPVAAKEHLGGASGWGVVLACEGVGLVVGSLIAVRIRTEHPLRMSVLLFFPATLVLLLLGLGQPLPVVAAGGAVTGLAFGVSNPFWFTVLQRHVPEEALSRVSSFDFLGSIVLNPIGYAAIGPLAAATSTSAVLIGTAAAATAVNLAIYSVPSVRHLRTPLVD